MFVATFPPYMERMRPSLPNIGLADLDALRQRLTAAFDQVWTMVAEPPREPVRPAPAGAVPVVWLLGKVQSGKSSIVQALTGATAAEVGNGFKACTRTAAAFDFPADVPVIRFLDTRGLGEASYDPTEDLAVAEQQAHLVLVTMRALDPAIDGLLAVVAEVRRRHPDWPLVVAHTALHEAYPPAVGHVMPYPFDGDGRPVAPLPGDLARSLTWQRAEVAKLPGRGAIAHVALDFTKADDGMEPRLYGLAALHDAVARVAPAAIAATLARDDAAPHDALAARAHPHIIGYATAAAAADVLPVAGAVAVPGVQAKMLHSLAAIYGIDWDQRGIAEFAGALGTGVVVRTLTSFAARQLAKLIPVYGQTAGAAAAAALSFATTYALGKAAVYYLGRKRLGLADAGDVAEAYREALRKAFDLSVSRSGDAGKGGQA